MLPRIYYLLWSPMASCSLFPSFSTPQWVPMSRDAQAAPPCIQFGQPHSGPSPLNLPNKDLLQHDEYFSGPRVLN
ncbi:hypothetical protein BDR07DRAFT_1387046, partial [Suillus spraguei]